MTTKRDAFPNELLPPGVRFGFLVLVSLLMAGWTRPQGLTQVLAQGCDKLGWFPDEFGLMDHSVFWHDGYYYLVSIHLYPDNRFAYARSVDLCNWVDLSPILSDRVPGTWDEQKIWSPHVYEEMGTFYMFYTGVTQKFTQSILLATSTNPADPDSWQPQGMVFQPNHEGMVWKNGTWADCRDPMIAKFGESYHLYYTGLDEGGGIVGLATSTGLDASWEDQGAILPADPGGMPESTTVIQIEEFYYLFYNQSFQGEILRVGSSPAGPWGEPYPFRPGWAHEVWQAKRGAWYVSYLTDKTVTISPLAWDTLLNPPWPFIGNRLIHLLLPLVMR